MQGGTLHRVSIVCSLWCEELQTSIIMQQLNKYKNQLTHLFPWQPHQTKDWRDSTLTYKHDSQ